MAGGGSFTSDQSTLNRATVSATVLRGARSRVSSIQGRGEAGSVLLLHDVDDAADVAAGNLKATYRWETEGIQLFVPGSGILFKTGVCATLTQTAGVDGSVTLTITGA